jgi:hypothetical protein
VKFFIKISSSCTGRAAAHDHTVAELSHHLGAVVLDCQLNVLQQPLANRASMVQLLQEKRVLRHPLHHRAGREKWKE